jgi:glycosyltransferase involved in cell wall biosynthesis
MTRRILFVTKVLGKGGAEKHLVDLIVRMDRSQLSLTIVCYGLDPFSEMFDHGGQPRAAEVVKECQPKGLLSFWRSFVRYKPGTIVFVNGNVGMLPRSAYLAARLSGAKRLVDILHSGPRPPQADHLAAPLNLLLKRLKRYIVGRISSRLCHKTICVSQTMRETLVRDYKYLADRTIAVPNGVDLNHYRRGNDQSKRIRDELNVWCADPLLLCVARLIPLKAIHILLEALVIIRNQRPMCACLIIGDGRAETELRATSAALGIAASVTFLGRAEDVRPYLELGDIFVLPSRWEGLPLVLLEAMAYGLPCVATDVGGNREAVVHGDTGLIVKSGSPEELAEAALYLAEHKTERERMGLKARQRVEDFFDVENGMAKIESIILE